MIRLSLGSAILLGLEKGRLDALPTTTYMLLGDRCVGNCSFCTQARESKDKMRVSRVIWPSYPIEDVFSALKNKCFKRICIQTLTYPELIDDLLSLVASIKKICDVPISTSVSPLSKRNLRELKAKGVERVGIALDATTPELFELIKGKGVNAGFHWDECINGLKSAVEIFHNMVTTHLIIGLGENDKEMLETVQQVWDMGVYPALFAFTPLPSLQLKIQAPGPQRYHAVQLAHYLIVNDITTAKKLKFDDFGKLIEYNVSSKLIEEIIKKGDAFRTSGCADCNRPFFNEKPQGPIYNYPQVLNEVEVKSVEIQIREYGVI
jgi:biotin synthase